MPVVSMSYLLEAGVHFGHQTKRWNPKMREYIFTARDDIYIIDLQKTAKKIEEAYIALKSIAENEGKVLFVGTKKQAQEAVREEAQRTGMYYINERWLGGTLTNFKTIRKRVSRLDEIEKMEQDGIFEALPKKEVIQIKKEYDKLNKNLCGIREMRKLPNALVIVDPKKEVNAIKEARKLSIPVFGIVDTNCDPDVVDYVVPANDDAIRAVKLVIGVLNNAIAEVMGAPMIDFITEEDKIGNAKEEKPKKEIKVEETVKEVIETVEEPKEEPTKAKEEVKIETPKKEKVIKEKTTKEKVEKKSAKKVVKEEKKEDISELTVADLKKLAKEKGIEGYSKMKKDELIKNLK